MFIGMKCRCIVLFEVTRAGDEEEGVKCLWMDVRVLPKQRQEHWINPRRRLDARKQLVAPVIRDSDVRRQPVSKRCGSLGLLVTTRGAIQHPCGTFSPVSWECDQNNGPLGLEERRMGTLTALDLVFTVPAVHHVVAPFGDAQAGAVCAPELVVAAGGH